MQLELGHIQYPTQGGGQTNHHRETQLTCIHCESYGEIEHSSSHHAYVQWLKWFWVSVTLVLVGLQQGLLFTYVRDTNISL